MSKPPDVFVNGVRLEGFAVDDDGIDIEPPAPGKPMATWAQICRAWVEYAVYSFIGPHQTDPPLSEDEIVAAAKRFWEASPTGELFHVFEAREAMLVAAWIGEDGFRLSSEAPQ